MNQTLLYRGADTVEEMNELFYKDAYRKEFDAKVLQCREGKKGYEIILSDTAFYPEGGGQPADHGFLDDIPVKDVKRREGAVVHYTDRPMEEGKTVHGKIDWERRFDLMQQHSGEHIYSGLVHKKFGYDNVGFHLDDIVTVDFSGPMTYEDALEIERQANELIYENQETKITYPSQEELKTLDYRSKIELTGKVRIVEFPGGDICACCGTHVARAGEIGLLKVLSLANHKGGVRIELVCGRRALKYLDQIYDLNKNLAVRYSVKPLETGEAVEKAEQEKEALKQKLNESNRRYFEAEAAVIPQGQKAVLFYEEDMTAAEIRKFCEYLIEKKKAEIIFVLSRKEEGVLNYAVGSPCLDLKEAAKDWNRRLNGRGGGKDIIQGSFRCTVDEAVMICREADEKLQGKES